MNHTGKHAMATEMVDPSRKGRSLGSDAAHELAQLREQVRHLESCLFELGARLDQLGLTTSEARVFGALLRRQALTKEQLLAILYADRPADSYSEIKIVDVHVCKIRSKLKRYGIEITTMWGHGYSISVETKTTVYRLLDQLGAQGAHAA